MAKFKIQPDPTFVGTVDVPKVGGGADPVPFTFKYLDRQQLAKLFSEWAEKVDAISKRYQEGATDLEAYSTEMIDFQVEQLLAIVSGWDYDVEFNAENAKIFVCVSVHAPRAVIGHYQDAFHKAKLGN